MRSSFEKTAFSILLLLSAATGLEARSASLVSRKEAVLQLVHWELGANPALNRASLQRMAEGILSRDSQIPASIETRIQAIKQQTLHPDHVENQFALLTPDERRTILDHLGIGELQEVAALSAQIEFLEVPEDLLNKASILEKFELATPDLKAAENFVRFNKDGVPYIRWFIHPLAGEHAKQLRDSLNERFHADLKIKRGRYRFHFTSSRSLIVFSRSDYQDVFSLKLSLPAGEGPFKNKSIHLKEWSAWARHNIHVADNVPDAELPHLKLQQENYGIGFSFHTNEDAFLFRSLKQLDTGHYLLPAFSIFDEKVGREIARMNGSNDPFSFWGEHLIKPLAYGQAELRAATGAEHTSPHSQNLLLELDENMRPTGKIVMRDFDFYVDKPVFAKLNRFGLDQDGLTRAAQETITFSLKHGMQTSPTWLTNEGFYDWMQRYLRCYRAGFSGFTGIPETLVLRDGFFEDNHSGRPVRDADKIDIEARSLTFTSTLSDKADFLQAYETWLEKRMTSKTVANEFRFSISDSDGRKSFSNAIVHSPEKPIELSSFNSFSSFKGFVTSLSAAVTIDQYSGNLESLLKQSANLKYSDRKRILDQLGQSLSPLKAKRLLENATDASAVYDFLNLLIRIDSNLVSASGVDLYALVDRHFWSREQKVLITSLYPRIQQATTVENAFRNGTYNEAMSALVNIRKFTDPTPHLIESLIYRIDNEKDEFLRASVAFEFARLAKNDSGLSRYLMQKLRTFDPETATRIREISGISDMRKFNQSQNFTRARTQRRLHRAALRCEDVFK